MNTPDQPGLTYRDAGVDIDCGNRLVERIREATERTRRPEVMGGIGGFGSLFQVPLDRYRKPVLVAGTDGVGTKLKLAVELDRHHTVGVDLVAMCVNDLVVQGAEPLFFLDYYATGRLDDAVAASVVQGIAAGCEQAGAALVGGETAEMPGMYAAGDYDLAGFCVGIVEADQIIDGSRVRPGDAILALASSGPHSNGYSLVRRVLERAGAELGSAFDHRTLGETLLEPTRIYVKPLLDLAARLPVHALAHITGGGLTENLPRVLPANTRARLDTASWRWPAIFAWLQEQGGIATEEMRRTFNCGVGMAVVVPAERAGEAVALLQEHGEQAWVLGTVEGHDGTPQVVYD